MLPFRQDSDVIMTSAPNVRQQSAILSSSVATTRTRDNYQSDLKEASQISTCSLSKYWIMKQYILLLNMIYQMAIIQNASNFTTFQTKSLCLKVQYKVSQIWKESKAVWSWKVWVLLAFNRQTRGSKYMNNDAKSTSWNANSLLI
jgi:hypothetical protein